MPLLVVHCLIVLLTLDNTHAAENSTTENEPGMYVHNIYKEVPIVKEQLYEEFQVPFLGKEFSISFELFINKLTTTVPWESVIHLTTDGNVGKMGDRIPGIWVKDGKTLHIAFAINGVGNTVKNVGALEENKWIKVEISQKPTADKKYNFEVIVDGQSVWKEENTTPALYSKPKVYIGDPWHPALEGKIKNLGFSSKKGECPDGWLMFKGKCFGHPKDKKLSWADAESYCQSWSPGAHLASIRSAEEQKFVQDNFPGNIWLGGSDTTEEGRWTWSDGTAWIYSNWHSGQPSNTGSGQDCIWTWYHNQWDDNTCDHMNLFLCNV